MSIFAGSESRRFFKILDIDASSLENPVSQWVRNSAYLKAKEIVENLRVVNDTAERGVKLCHDFLVCAKKEATFQKILQVVKHNRENKPARRNQSKK